MAGEIKTILIVDDEPDIRDFLTTFLEDNGYKTITANDGNEGLERVRETRPDLVTLDISMPEKSGVRFYREMKQSNEFSKIPIVIVTGVSSDFEKFISTRKQIPPPEGYIAKPIDHDRLLDKVRSLIS